MESLANTQNGVNGESVQLPVERDWKRGHDREHVTTHNHSMAANHAKETMWTLGMSYAKHLHVQVSKHVKTQT